MTLGSRATIGIAVGVAACMMLAVAPRSASQPTDDRVALQAALDAALDDERLAEAFYEAIMAKHGRVRPFANIVNAERCHQNQLLGQYQRFGLTPPSNRWKDHVFDVPPTFAECCDESIVAEIRNARIYDGLLASVQDEQVRAVFERLRWMSLERHLPAFRRHSNGWKEVEVDALCDDHSAMNERATTARKAMFAALIGELTVAMEDGGPSEAITVCADRAPAVSAAISAKHNVRMGRTSHKLRNPGNKPPVWAELLVDERPSEPRVLTDDAGRLGALTPITLSATCLQCHGTTAELAPGVSKQLAKRYPDDAATGFKEGDVRGWFWVEVPAPTTPE